MKTFIIPTVMYLSISVQTVFAQCNPAIKPSDNKSLKYQMRDSRCEGFYTALVGSSNMELVSFTLGDFIFADDPNEVITIKPNKVLSTTLNITALGIPKDLFYRMDAQISPEDQQQIWRASDVLTQNSRTKLSRNIGVLGYYEEKDKKFYTPLVTSTLIAKNEDEQKTREPILKIICNTRVTDVRYKIDNQKDIKITESNRNYPGGIPILIKLPKNLTGEHTIEIKARKFDSTQWVTKKLDIKI